MGMVLLDDIGEPFIEQNGNPRYVPDCFGKM